MPGVVQLLAILGSEERAAPLGARQQIESRVVQRRAPAFVLAAGGVALDAVRQLQLIDLAGVLPFHLGLFVGMAAVAGVALVVDSGVGGRRVADRAGDLLPLVVMRQRKGVL